MSPYVVPPSSGYSSRVELWLESEHGRVKLSQVGFDFVIAAEPFELPAASRARVVVSVDGREQRLDYTLVDGLSEGQNRSKTVYAEGDTIPI
ncbi:MAG: hypothetical protein AAGA57_02855 [Planctomycetota bacterium]